MSIDLEKILVELQNSLEQIYRDRLVNIILYGSQARGDARPDSDIDVLVVLQDPVDFTTEIERSSYAISALCLKYEILISCAFIGKERFNRQQGGFLRNVRREGILL